MQVISKKIDDSYIVWFQPSNRWIQFEEPAWFVNKLYQKGQDNYTISLKCAKKYRLDTEECSQFVNSICANIRESCEPLPIASSDSFSKSFEDSFTSEKYAVRNYKIGDKCIVIEYSSRLAEYYIHPPLAHLETKLLIERADAKFEIVERENLMILRKDENSETLWVYRDFIRLKKRLYINLANVIFNKTNEDWLSFVHASAVTNGKQTLLLCSSSGSGKSTMAALLQTKGLQIVSDDFVPIDAKSKLPYPFPAALSVKPGAFSFLSPYYESLQESNFNSSEPASKSVRYLALNASDLTLPKPKPLKHILFLRYNPSISCKFRKVPVVEALKLFHEQAWVSSDPKHARTFINWFVKLKCYSLEYGNSERGIEKVMGIFNEVSE